MVKDRTIYQISKESVSIRIPLLNFVLYGKRYQLSHSDLPHKAIEYQLAHHPTHHIIFRPTMLGWRSLPFVW